MDKELRQQLEQKNKEGYDKSETEMRPVYNEQKSALDEIEVIIAMVYLKHAIDGLLKANRRQKQVILQQIDEKINRIYNDLGKDEVKTVSGILSNRYNDIYNHYESILQGKPPKANKSDLSKAVNTPIDGELFSDRIWKNKRELAVKLRKATNDIMQGKTTVDAAGKQIEKIFNVSAYESKRLLGTEVTRAQAQATIDAAKASGIKRLMWSAKFENTCSECMALDGKIFDIDKIQPPPLHPNCHCVLIAPPDEQEQEKVNKDDTNDGNSDIIKERVVRSPEYKVNKEYINSKEYEDKFKNFGNQKLNNSVLKETRDILKKNDKKNTESMAIIDETGKVLSRQDTGPFGGEVDLSCLDNLQNSVVLTHNHPGSTSFSPDDIALLLDNPQIKTMVAGGHNGTVYKLSVENGTRLGISDLTNENKVVQEYRRLLDDINEPNKVVDLLVNKYNWDYEVM